MRVHEPPLITPLTAPVKKPKASVPFPMLACHATGGFRERQMEEALKHEFARLPNAGVAPTREERLTIVGYGPSLLDTWQDIQHPMITTSGAHDFMISRGVIPDYHADMDPRAHKLDFIRNSHPDVTYCMASHCPPETWEILKDRRVLLWHCWSAPETMAWVAQVDPDTQVQRGGSAIGLGAITVGSRLGYRRFAAHGFDCSISKGQRHAGPHRGLIAGHEPIFWQVEDNVFMTTKIMVNTAFEFMDWLKEYGLDITVHGTGLLPHMVGAGSRGRQVDLL